ncbi:MAG: hypothetical protein ACKVX7_12175 [Planctomycetota bacterium]
MLRALILCTGNSCRSQLAEAHWRELGQGAWQCYSAGTEPTGIVHPLALQVLAESGLDTARLRSKRVDEFRHAVFDIVVTVCDSAREACPVFPGQRVEHWPFPDPATATGAEREQLAVMRDTSARIRHRIAEFLAQFPSAESAAALFARWMSATLDLVPGGLAAPERDQYRRLIAATRDVLARDPSGRELWATVPQLIQAEFGSRGWRWNGVYARRNGVLELIVAAGPPVCAQLEPRGGIGRSGMCYDALLMNQTLVAADVRRWPGYVSCDDESGLTTVSGMVCPLRSAFGTPVAIWDLDSTAPLAPSDPLFFDRYFATLSALVPSVDP